MIPDISIITPLKNTNVTFFTNTYLSIINQTIKNWEWVLVDDGSTDMDAIAFLRTLSKFDDRIVLNLSKPYGISASTNIGATLAKSNYVALLDHDDTLEPTALEDVLNKLKEGYDIVYTDQDKIDPNGNYCQTFKKPDFDMGLLNRIMYIGHLVALRRGVITDNWFDTKYDFTQDYEFLLRVCASGKYKIGHVPKVLYHWVMHPQSTAMVADLKNGISTNDLQLKAIKSNVDKHPLCLQIVFVLYEYFVSNSAIHVHNLANELVLMGHDVFVVVPHGKDSISNLYSPLYEYGEYEDLCDKWITFDIVHLWTYRQACSDIYSKIVERYSKIPYNTIIHFEDNEGVLGADMPIYPENVDGYTTIIETLFEKLPEKNKETMCFWPGYSPETKCIATLDTINFEAFRNNNIKIIGYFGNVNTVNAPYMQAFYDTVKEINNAGVSVVVLKTGSDTENMVEENDCILNLGYVNSIHMGWLYSQCDYMIQIPAFPEFDDYRFPSKIPDLLYSNVPTILPNINISKFLTHDKDAIILDEFNVENLKRILQSDNTHIKGRNFAESNLSWTKSAKKLEKFYFDNLRSKACSPEYASVHVPKTAGTTFRKGLQDLLGDDFKMCHPFDIKDHSGNPLIIHGHIRASIYLKMYPNSKLITWVRNPLDRLISHYIYSRTHLLKDDLSNWIHNKRVILDNVQNGRDLTHGIAYFIDVDLSNFVFIGNSDDFDNEIVRFYNFIGYTPPRKDSRNRSEVYYTLYHPFKKWLLSDDEYVFKLNKFLEKDYEVYNKAMRLIKNEIQ